MDGVMTPSASPRTTFHCSNLSSEIAADHIETAAVRVTVLGLNLVHGGRLLALAAVEIDIEGIVIGLDGVRVVQLGPHRLGVEPPAWRAGAQSRPAVILPPELTSAIAGAVLDLYQSARDAAAKAKTAAPGGRPAAEAHQRPVESMFGRVAPQRAWRAAGCTRGPPTPGEILTVAVLYT
jgi:hypothetical protein